MARTESLVLDTPLRPQQPWAAPVHSYEPVAWPRKGSRAFGVLRTRSDGSKRRHNGVDLFAPLGTPVVAVADGRVTHASDVYLPGFSGYGRVVVLRTDMGPYVLYSHLDDVRVEAGQSVERGRVLGTVGDTAFTREDPSRRFQSSKPHIHFEVAPRPYPQSSTAPRIDPTALYFDVRPRYTEKGRLHVVRKRKPANRWVLALGVGTLVYLARKGNK